MTLEELAQTFELLRGDMVKGAEKALQNHADADDVVQKTFLDLMERGIDLVRMETVRSYLFRRLFWNVYNMQDPTRKIVESILDYQPADTDEAGDFPFTWVLDESAIDVRDALLKLPKDQRTAVESVVVSGRTFIETGKLIWPKKRRATSRMKAAQLFQEGLESLRLLLQGYGRS